ncbi:MAG: BON domain-containing protein [Bdellovibrionales bacterium]
MIDIRKNGVLVLGVLALAGLQGCAAAVVGAAGVAGVSAAQEGGLSRAVSDAAIQTEINDLWFRHDVEMFRKLDMTVKEGRVLLTGVVQNPEHRVEAVRLAWQPKGVTQVINEIQVADSGGISGYARDAWITARLRTALTLDKKVQTINYSIDTVRSVVYLMGVAQDQAELDQAVKLARGISDVQQVVSYVKIVGDDVQGVDTGGNDIAPQAGYQSGDAPMTRDAAIDNNVNSVEWADDNGAAQPLNVGEPQPLVREDLMSPKRSDSDYSLSGN